MEIKEIHKQTMKLLGEVVHANLPEDSEIIVKFYFIKAIRELHRCIIEEIKNSQELKDYGLD